jgi:hypothetical protein
MLLVFDPHNGLLFDFIFREIYKRKKQITFGLNERKT